MRTLTGRSNRDTLVHDVAAFVTVTASGWAYWLPCTGQFLGGQVDGRYIVDDGRVVTCLLCMRRRSRHEQ